MISVAAGGGETPSNWLDLIPGIDKLSRRVAEALPPSFIENAETHIMHVLLTLVAIAVIVMLALKAKSNFDARADEKLTVRTFFELIFDGLMGVMETQMGRKNAERFLPLIGTLAVFIFVCNAFALLPGGLPPTDNLNTTAAPAIIVFAATHVVGVKEHGLHYFEHFLGPIIKWYALPLMLLMVIIEIIGHLARPLSLSLRLMGNMFGDHAVLAAFLAIFPFFLPIPNMLLGTIVVIVQTMVFCLLSIVYIAMAIEHGEEEGHH